MMATLSCSRGVVRAVTRLSRANVPYRGTVSILTATSSAPTPQSVRSLYTRTEHKFEPTYQFARKGGNKGGKGGKGGKEKDEDEDSVSANDIDLSGITDKMEATLSSFTREISNFRVGKASPDLLDKVMVNVHGKETMLSKVAAVTVKDPLTLLVNVFDESVSKFVEAGIKEAKSLSILELSASNQGGGVIKVVVPKPTQEFRQTLIKNSSKSAENSKVIVRKHRKDAMDLSKKHKLSKDEERRFETKVQTLTDDYIKKIDAAHNQKVKEINN